MSERVDDVTCREIVEAITDYLEGAMNPDDRERFERHLGACAGCTRALEQFRATIEVTGRLTEDRVDATQRAASLQLFTRWRSDDSGG
jgi:anti-sigma factor RsiW